MVVFSKFKTIPTTCIEYVHPWTESCSSATTGLGVHALQGSFRIYVTVYMVCTELLVKCWCTIRCRTDNETRRISRLVNG